MAPSSDGARLSVEMTARSSDGARPKVEGDGVERRRRALNSRSIRDFSPLAEELDFDFERRSPHERDAARVRLRAAER